MERAELGRSSEGAASVEYVVLVALVALGLVAALLALGGPLVTLYRFQRAWLLLPLP